MNKYDYIAETDLKQFFPSVKIFAVERMMQMNGFPSDVCRYFTELHMTSPKLPRDRKLDESKYVMLDLLNDPSESPKFEGLPQGSPTSPLLSISVLPMFLSEQRNIEGGEVMSISYADDPIFYSDAPFQI